MLVYILDEHSGHHLASKDGPMSDPELAWFIQWNSACHVEDVLNTETTNILSFPMQMASWLRGIKNTIEIVLNNSNNLQKKPQKNIQPTPQTRK